MLGIFFDGDEIQCIRLWFHLFLLRKLLRNGQRTRDRFGVALLALVKVFSIAK